MVLAAAWHTRTPPKPGVKRYLATLDPNVLERKSFSGRKPQNRSEELELSHQEADEMIPRIRRQIPFCYNHDIKIKLAQVVNANRDGRRFDAEIECDTKDPYGSVTSDLIERTGVCDISLAHYTSARTKKGTRIPCEPIEASHCVKGARRGAKIYAVWDSNLGKYVPLDSLPSRINASESSTPPQELVLVIRASEDNMDVDLPPPAGSEPPAAVPPSPPAASAPPPPTATKTDPVPMEDDEEEKKESDDSPPKDDKLSAEISQATTVRDLVHKLQSGKLHAKDRAELQKLLVETTLENSNRQKELEEYRKREAAEREKKLLEEKKKIDEQLKEEKIKREHLLRIISDVQKNMPPDHPLYSETVKASADSDTTTRELSVLATALAHDVSMHRGSFSNKVLRVIDEHLEQLKQKQSVHLSETTRRKQTKASSTAAAAAAAASESDKQRKNVKAAAMQDESDDEDMPQVDKRHMIKAAAYGGEEQEEWTGQPLRFPPRMFQCSETGEVRGSAKELKEFKRDYDSTLDILEQDLVLAAKTYAGKPFEPWKAGTAAHFDMSWVSPAYRKQVATLWSAASGGNGMAPLDSSFKGMTANTLVWKDLLSADTIRDEAANLRRLATMTHETSDEAIFRSMMRQSPLKM